MLLTPAPSESLALWEIMRQPLPHHGLVDAWLIRGLSLIARARVVTMRGLEHVCPSRDPFIVALNHSTRIEALLVPALLILHRNGRLIHFLADWNFRLIPGVGALYRRAETVTVTRKSTRPYVFNVLKPLYRHSLSVIERTRVHLVAGRSVGIFPEGTVNRDPRRLMGGRKGAAYLSLITGAPVVPVGIRFPDTRDGLPASERDRMEVVIGAALSPPPLATRISPSTLDAWHAAVMNEIARLSGKLWLPKVVRTHEQT